MSDENLSRKLKEASLLASKFFSDLAVIFDSKPDANLDYLKNSKKVHLPINQSSEAHPLKVFQKLEESSLNNNGKQSGKSSEAKSKSKKNKGDDKKVQNGQNNGQPQIKKPLSAYMLFNNHRRPVLKEEYPECSVPDISKLIGEEWKKLSENQQKPWIDKANDLRLQYKIDTFNQEQNHIGEKPLPSKKQISDEAHKKVSNAQAKIGDKRAHSEINSTTQAATSLMSSSKQLKAEPAINQSKKINQDSDSQTSSSEDEIQNVQVKNILNSHQNRLGKSSSDEESSDL